MDEVVEVERIDLVRIESAEAFAYVIEDLAEFGLVVLADQLSGSAATRSRLRPTSSAAASSARSRRA